MYDTTHLWIPTSSIETFDLERLKPKLNRIREFNSENGFGFGGYIKNISLKVFEKGVSIQGSLPKFWHGNNLSSIEFGQMDQAIESICKSLDNFPVYNCEVTRLDLAHCIETNYSPINYIPYLGHVTNMNRAVTNSSSIYWQPKNKTRTLLFYDKIAEVKSKNALLPSMMIKGKILARFETRYMRKAIKKRFNKEITVHDLCKYELFESMVETWENDYHSIHKIDPYFFNFDNMSTPNGFCKEVQNYGFRALGSDAINQQIKLLKEKKSFNSSVAISRLKSIAKRAYAQNSNNPMIEELNQKVKLIIKSQIGTHH